MMLKKLRNILWDNRSYHRINIALSKGLASRELRRIDYTKPLSWEFSGFSQNGEDGIIDVLLKSLTKSNRYFLEIGSSDGLENNTSWLLVAEKYSGLMLEGDMTLVERANRTVTPYSIGAWSHQIFVSKKNVEKIRALSLELLPDLMSLDIDGNDYYIAEALFSVGFRPKIFVVEYNSVYGPKRKMTIKYSDDFSYSKSHSSLLYYGASISAWRALFEMHGYQFVTVDSHGVNAFFVDPEYFKEEFLSQINPVDFVENAIQLRRFRAGHKSQYELIKDQSFVEL